MSIHLSLSIIIIIIKNLQHTAAALTWRVFSPVAFISNEVLRKMVGYYFKEKMIFHWEHNGFFPASLLTGRIPSGSPWLPQTQDTPEILTHRCSRMRTPEKGTVLRDGLKQKSYANKKTEYLNETFIKNALTLSINIHFCFPVCTFGGVAQ